MIYDKINNIKLYKGLSDDMYLGLQFLKNATPDIENGVHEFNTKVKAIVSEYKTKVANEYGYDAHSKYIDIQYLLSGTEKVCCLPVEKLQEKKPYKEDIDAAFYTANVQPIEMELGNGYFAIYYPQDGHMPCLCVERPENVKKIVIKVRIGE